MSKFDERIARTPLPILLIYAREVVGGPYCGGADEGEQFGRTLEAIWDRADRIRVSFRGVEVIELAFFQAAFRHLARRHPVADILAKLEVVNPSERVLNLIEAAARFTGRDQGPGAGGQG